MTRDAWLDFKARRAAQYKRDERIKTWLNDAWDCLKVTGTVGWLWILFMVLYA